MSFICDAEDTALSLCPEICKTLVPDSRVAETVQGVIDAASGVESLEATFVKGDGKPCGWIWNQCLH